MGKKKFLIELDRPAAGAHIGEIRGTVVLETKKDKKYKSIKAAVRGVANTAWEEHVRDGEETRIVHYRSTKEYAKKSVVLWTNDAAPDKELEKGEYRFPFVLPLEGTVPSTFSGEHGRIQYEVSAIIDKSKRGKDDKVITVPVPAVHELLDLNTLPDVREPKTKQEEKTICCLCCASGPISLTARISRTGFFCGKDRIGLKVELENGSSRPVDKVSAEIRKEVHYTAQPTGSTGGFLGGSRHRYETIVEVASNAVEPGSSLSWSPDNLLVPKTDPTNTNCSIISVKYYLKVEADIPLALDAAVTFPLIIGTVPLNE